MRKDSRIRQLSEINSEGRYKKFYAEGGNKYLTLEGAYHHNMVTRATNPNYREKFPSYRDVTISDNFLDYQFFVEWCRNQAGFGNLGWVLDKDIVGKGEKKYSEDFCVFVPAVINAMYAPKKNNRGLPTGVSWCESEGKYKAYCAQLNGKNKTLGRFSNPESASRAYADFKNQMIEKLIEEYVGRVDPRVISVMSVGYRESEHE